MTSKDKTSQGDYDIAGLYGQFSSMIEEFRVLKARNEALENCMTKCRKSITRSITIASIVIAGAFLGGEDFLPALVKLLGEFFH